MHLECQWTFSRTFSFCSCISGGIYFNALFKKWSKLPFLRPSKIFLFPKAELFKKFSVILEKSNYSVTIFREETKSN